MTVAQLDQTMSHRELMQWQAYDKIDPIGGYRQDINTAFIAYLAYGDRDKQTINDFLVIDPEPMSAKLKAQTEISKQKQRLERQAAQLAADFQRVQV